MQNFLCAYCVDSARSDSDSCGSLVVLQFLLGFVISVRVEGYVSELLLRSTLLMNGARYSVSSFDFFFVPPLVRYCLNGEVLSINLAYQYNTSCSYHVYVEKFDFPVTRDVHKIV